MLGKCRNCQSEKLSETDIPGLWMVMCMQCGNLNKIGYKKGFPEKVWMAQRKCGHRACDGSLKCLYDAPEFKCRTCGYLTRFNSGDGQCGLCYEITFHNQELKKKGEQMKSEQKAAVTEARADDLWKQRNATMRCTSCMYFVEKEMKNTPDSFEMWVGRCRRHSPTLNGWPVIRGGDWCGDHKLDENKV